MQVYKAFVVEGGVLKSLSATGPLEHIYKFREWSQLLPWQEQHGLGFFAFEDLEAAHHALGKGGYIAVCETTELLSRPRALLSQEQHPPKDLSVGRILTYLDPCIVEMVEPGTIWCRDIRPLNWA
jgi:hypothetical protein